MKKAMKVLGILLVLLLMAAPLKLIGYAAPYDDGFDAGYSAGYDTGYWDVFNGDYYMSYDDSTTGTSQYRNGYKEGYAQGYEAGWETGLEELSKEEEPETPGCGCTHEVNINNQNTIIINNGHDGGTRCNCGLTGEIPEGEIPEEDTGGEEVSYVPYAGWMMLFDFILECTLKCIKAAMELYSLDIHTDGSFSWDITDNINLTINGGFGFGLR